MKHKGRETKKRNVLLEKVIIQNVQLHNEYNISGNFVSIV